MLLKKALGRVSMAVDENLGVMSELTSWHRHRGCP